MRDELLSIGEMARLKGVTVKALRYYERIGVLAPAYVDPQTGYRYYELSQSVDVDVITMCSELGMPLKELASYRGADGKYELAALLEHGRRIAHENLLRARKLVIQAESYRDGVFASPQGLARNLGSRELLLLPWGGGGFDARRYVRISSMIYDTAERQGYVSLFLMGMVRLPEDGSWNICVEVRQLCESGGLARGAAGDEGTRPAGGGTQAYESRCGGHDRDYGCGRDGGARLYRAPAVGYTATRIEGSSYAECFSAAFETPPSAGPLFAFETWERECDPGHVIVDVVAGEASAAC